MSKRPQRSDVSGTVKGDVKSLDFHPYYEELGVGDVFSISSLESITPKTGIKPFFTTKGGFDSVTKRLGVYYLRMPYYDREVAVELADRIYQIYSRVKEGDPYNWLARHDEFRIQNRAGTLNNDAKSQAAYMAHFIMHYRYLSTALILSYVQALVVGRIEGLPFSPDLTATLRFSVLNAMLSRFNGMPYDSKYLKLCLDAMAVLGDRNDKSIMIAVPQWLPLGMTYFNDVPVINKGALVEDKLEYVTAKTMRHLDVEEYLSYSGLWNRLTATNEDDGWHAKEYGVDAPFGMRYGFSRIAPMTFNYSKNLGWWVDHWAEIADGYSDLFFERFVNNSEFPRMNVAIPQSTIGRLWFELGVVDSQLQAGDLGKFADEVSARFLDLQDYARQNWSAFASSFGPTFRPVVTLNRVTTPDTTNKMPHAMANEANAYALDAFNDPDGSELEYHLATLVAKYSSQVGRPYVPITHCPYVYAYADQSYNSFDMFIEGGAYKVETGLNEADENSTDDGNPVTMAAVSDMNVYPASLGRLIRAIWDTLSYTNCRFVNEKTAGKFLESSVRNPEAFAEKQLLLQGIYVPRHRLSPVIDPNDPWVHGIHEVFTMRNGLDITNSKDWSNENVLTPYASVGRYVIAVLRSAQAEVTGWGNDTEDFLVATGINYNTSVDSLKIAAFTTSARAMIGCYMHFTGDLLNEHPATLLLRVDNHRMAHNYLGPTKEATNVALGVWTGYDSRTLLPVAPFRGNFGYDTFTMLLSEPGVLRASKDGINFDSNNPENFSISWPLLTNEQLKPGIYLHSLNIWLKSYVPWAFPSVMRLRAEYTDGGMFQFIDRFSKTDMLVVSGGARQASVDVQKTMTSKTGRSRSHDSKSSSNRRRTRIVKYPGNKVYDKASDVDGQKNMTDISGLTDLPDSQEKRTKFNAKDQSGGFKDKKRKPSGKSDLTTEDAD